MTVSCIWEHQRKACDHNFSKGNNWAASPLFSRLLFFVLISSCFSSWRFWGQYMAVLPTVLSELGAPSSSEENPSPFSVSGADGSVWIKQVWKSENHWFCLLSGLVFGHSDTEWLNRSWSLWLRASHPKCFYFSTPNMLTTQAFLTTEE